MKILMAKKMDYFKTEYKKNKTIKRLPAIDRKFVIELTRARLVHFSKYENEMILSRDANSLSDHAKKIYSTSGNLDRDLRVFRQDL
jgi:hypothetical protein